MDGVKSGRDFTTNSTSPIPPTSPFSPSHERLLLANHILHIVGGQILLPILFVTMVIGGEAKKNPLLTNFVFSWILFSTVSLLLFYGGSKMDREPTVGLCLVQASLNYGVQAMTVITSMSVVIQAWNYLRTSTRPNATLRIYGWPTTLLITSSYASLIGFAAAGVILGVNYPNDLGRTHNIFVCDLPYHHLGTTVGFLCGVCGLVVSICGLWICIIIYRNRAIIQYWRLHYTSPDFAMILRTVAFIFYGLTVVVMSVMSLLGFSTVDLYIVLALLPTVAFLIFGTRRATTSLWRKWLHLPSPRKGQGHQKRASDHFNSAPGSEPRHVISIRRRPEPQTRQSEVAFLETDIDNVKEMGRKYGALYNPSTPSMRRGWSDAADVFEVQTLPHSGTSTPKGKELANHSSSYLPDGKTINAQGYFIPPSQFAPPPEMTGEIIRPNSRGPSENGGGKTLKRPAIIQWTSQPWLPPEAQLREQSGGVRNAREEEDEEGPY